MLKFISNLPKLKTNIKYKHIKMKESKNIEYFLKEPFKILEKSIGKEGTKRQKAIKILSESGYEKRDIEYIIEKLIANGHIYQVKETIYITPTD